jgi:hypothetical protein
LQPLHAGLGFVEFGADERRNPLAVFEQRELLLQAGSAQEADPVDFVGNLLLFCCGLTHVSLIIVGANLANLLS